MTLNLPKGTGLVAMDKVCLHQRSKSKYQKSKVKIMGELRSVFEFREGRIIKMPHSVKCF